MAIHHIEALDFIAQGDWDSAHTLIQDFHDQLACHIHGYLHREEGDEGNAAYWYSQFGQAVPDNTLEEEFELLYNLASADI